MSAARPDPPAATRAVGLANPFGLQVPDGLLDALADRVVPITSRTVWCRRPRPT
jgi:hypothetical protein